MRKDKQNSQPDAKREADELRNKIASIKKMSAKYVYKLHESYYVMRAFAQSYQKESYMPYAKLFEELAFPLQSLIGFSKAGYDCGEYREELLQKLKNGLPNYSTRRVSSTLNKSRWKNYRDAENAINYAMNELKNLGDHPPYQVAVERIMLTLLCQMDADHMVGELKASGIYPLFYEDVKEDPELAGRFIPGDETSVAYPGLFIKKEGKFEQLGHFCGSYPFGDKGGKMADE